MTPTNELRFIEREIVVYETDEGKECKTIRILQQKWARYHHIETQRVVESEWRDVPCVKEST